MSKEDAFLVYAIEYYRLKKDLSGLQVADLFKQHGIYQLIRDNYFLYHIENPEHMVADIDHYIATGEVLEPA